MPEAEFPPLEPTFALIASRLAIEGVPVCAIARALQKASADVGETLRYHIEIGTITELPKWDWPPTSRRADRLPSSVKHLPESSVVMSLERLLKLTPLEASFMLVFLKRDEVDKETLHHVIETQRALRRSRPNTSEPTDPKMVDVIICKMRTKFRPYKIQIKTLWGSGYYLADDGRDIVERLLGASIDAPQTNNPPVG
jgi:hypothetical protein